MILATLLAKLLGCPSVGLMASASPDLAETCRALSLEGQGLCLAGFTPPNTHLPATITDSSPVLDLLISECQPPLLFTHYHRLMRRFPPPWTVEKIAGGLKVVDANGRRWKHGAASLATRESFSVVAWDGGGTRRWGVCHIKEGGSDVLHVSYLSHGPIVCHGTLQSAGNASWPLYRRARQC
jgi:hypothetical protein